MTAEPWREPVTAAIPQAQPLPTPPRGSTRALIGHPPRQDTETLLAVMIEERKLRCGTDGSWPPPGAGSRIPPTPCYVREPECQGIRERWIRTLKEEGLHLHDFTTLEEARQTMASSSSETTTRGRSSSTAFRRPPRSAERRRVRPPDEGADLSRQRGSRQPLRRPWPRKLGSERSDAVGLKPQPGPCVATAP
jgi:hypothetical protein